MKSIEYCHSASRSDKCAASELSYTGCSLNIVFFPYNFVIILNSAISAAALVFYLPVMCTHTDTDGKQ